MNKETAEAVAEAPVPGFWNGMPVVMIVERPIGVGGYLHAEPVVKPPAGNVGWMAGGNLIGSSDSRFREMSRYPLELHDRSETQELYNSLCE
jgi:hypothetical protein